MNELKLVEEFFTLPFGLEEVEVLDGEPLYSSEKLKEKFASSIKDSYISSFYDIFKILIDKNIIRPVYTTSGFIEFLKRKAYANEFEQGTLGFYHTVTNRIYILVENNSKHLFWTSSNDRFGELALHELLHYAAHNESKIFYTKFNDIYQTYFSTFFSDVFGVEFKNKKSINEYLVFVHKTIELGRKLNKNILLKYGNLLDKIMSEYVHDSDEREYHIKIILTVLKLYLTDPMQLMHQLKISYDLRKIYFALLDSYASIGIKNPDTFAVQELLFPSEVMCIASANPKLLPIIKPVIKILV